MLCVDSDVLLGARGEIEDDSVPKSAVEKPPSTPEMSAHEAENMADAMLRDSPLPDAERSNEGHPQGSGSDKLLEEKDGEKLPEGGNVKLPKESPTGKHKKLVLEKVLFLCS